MLSGRHKGLSVWSNHRGESTPTDGESDNVTPISSVRPKRRVLRRERTAIAQEAPELVARGASGSDIRELTAAIKGLTKAITQTGSTTTHRKTGS